MRTSVKSFWSIPTFRKATQHLMFSHSWSKAYQSSSGSWARQPYVFTLGSLVSRYMRVSSICSWFGFMLRTLDDHETTLTISSQSLCSCLVISNRPLSRVAPCWSHLSGCLRHCETTFQVKSHQVDLRCYCHVRVIYCHVLRYSLKTL